MHLKVIEQMSRVPRSVGIPPLSDSSFEQAFATHAALAAGTSTSSLNSAIVAPFSVASDNSTIANSNNLQNINFSYGFGGGSGDGDGDDRRANPLAGMGLTDEQYNVILQNFVNGEGIMSSMGIGMGLGTGLGSGAGISMDGGGREKRALEEAWDGREGKRSRFEVVE